MNDLERKVLAAAREWSVERQPRDLSEKALFVAVVRAWPDELSFKENCTCGEQDDCDECPTQAQTEAMIAALEREISPQSSSLST